MLTFIIFPCEFFVLLIILIYADLVFYCVKVLSNILRLHSLISYVVLSSLFCSELHEHHKYLG